MCDGQYAGPDSLNINNLRSSQTSPMAVYLMVSIDHFRELNGDMPGGVRHWGPCNGLIDLCSGQTLASLLFHGLLCFALCIPLALACLWLRPPFGLNLLRRLACAVSRLTLAPFLFHGLSSLPFRISLGL